jgi:malonyl-CoA decarboxylase
MPQFFTNLLRNLRGARGTDMRLLCRQLLSQRGEASQTVLGKRIIDQYKEMDSLARLDLFRILADEFDADQNAIHKAIEAYRHEPTPAMMAVLGAAAEPPRQELFRRLNTAPGGTEALVGMRGDLLHLLPLYPELAVVDSDLKHLFRSWFNRGFLRLERIGWQTSALTLEKLIEYESVHEINGWPDLRRRLEADRRCFAFFQPALAGEPVIFVEVALTHGFSGSLEPLLDIHAPVLPLDKVDTAIFYSINNCLEGLRGIPFGSFLIKQVVEELGAELPKVRTYSTLSPLPLFARELTLKDDVPHGFTRPRLSRLLADFSADIKKESGVPDVVDAFFELLKDPLAHQRVLGAPLRRLALVYLTELRSGAKPFDPVANFHFSNGARLESIYPFANTRRYGLHDSFGVMVSYRYIPEDLEENHERFVRDGDVRVSPDLLREQHTAAALWRGKPEKVKPAKPAAAVQKSPAK